jgi:hypothetical protein
MSIGFLSPSFRVSTLLRIAAAVSLTWAVVLWCCRPMAFGAAVADTPLFASLAGGLAIAHVGWAFLLWRAAPEPGRERSILYGALIVFALRAMNGTYQVLYVLDGPAAMTILIDMVTSLALFVGILNALPQTLRGSERKVEP